MHVLLVTICYPPEIRAISTMMRELAEDLVRRGHSVTVLTSWPQYNLSVEARARTFTMDAHEHGVRIIRVRTLPTHKVAFVLRGFAQVLLPWLFTRAYRRYIREPVDAVIVYTPHLPLARVGAWCKRRFGARFLLNVQDIFPQNAIDLGILRNRMLIRYFERMEHAAYAAADVITTHTPGGREFLIGEKGVPVEKVSVVPNWIDTAAWDAAVPDGQFRRAFALEGKFVLLFAGVLGPAQCLEFIVDVATKLVDVVGIHFLFVGDGSEAAQLKARVAERGLQNVRFAPFVDPDAYPRLVKEMDVGLVCLGPQNHTATVPGKLWGFMAAARPIIAFLNTENDGHRIILDAQCGFAAQSDDTNRAAALVRKAYAQRATLAAFGCNGRVYVAAQFGKRQCIDALERLLG